MKRTITCLAPLLAAAAISGSIGLAPVIVTADAGTTIKILADPPPPPAPAPVPFESGSDPLVPANTGADPYIPVPSGDELPG
jgi:hypothetical protein